MLLCLSFYLITAIPTSTSAYDCNDVHKGPCKKTTPKFSKELNDAYQEHKSTCNEWRKAGRPSSADHPAKHAKLISQRKIQRISRDEMANHARANHDDLMATHKTNISSRVEDTVDTS